MQLDFTLRRGSRAGARRFETDGAPSVRIVFMLAASLAGCVGSIDAEKTTGPADPPGKPGAPSVTGPSACKMDQIGLSPMRRLTRVQYDNSINDLLGVDLRLSAHFSEDELAGSFPGNYFTPISESQYSQY